MTDRSAEGAGSSERRQAERTKSSKALALVVDSAREDIANHAFALDLSRLGARVRTPLRLEEGQRVTIIPREGRAFAVESRVIWISDSPPGEDAEAGLIFLEPQPTSGALLSEL